MLLQFLPDFPLISDPTDFGELNNEILVHPDVQENLDQWPQLRDKTSIVLQRLAVEGQTRIIKRIGEGINRGWRRSPLGGGGGMQYYLWWAISGATPLVGEEWPRYRERNCIAIRAIRHHDDHRPLNPGAPGDYYHINQCDIDGGDKGSFGNPWTEEQRGFASDDSPVRVLHGLPGSGKTWGLWKAVESRNNQRVLYITYSGELARNARRRFRSFAPSNVDVNCLDFITFLSRICKFDVNRPTLEESRVKLAELLRDSKVFADVLGPWSDRHVALHAVLRADIFGAVIPGTNDSIPLGRMYRLADKAFRIQRSNDYRESGLWQRLPRPLRKKTSADYLLGVLNAVEDVEAWETVFPELAACFQAFERLRTDALSKRSFDYDRIVIDEIQDLTLLEISVVVELCKAISRNRPQAPWLLVAGDDGQTVLPTGFDWGATNDLLANDLQNPEDYHLEDNLRSSTRLAAVVNRASSYYKDMPRDIRPTNQQHTIDDDIADVEIFHVEISDSSVAVWLLEQLDGLEDLAILIPDNNIPAWVPQDLRNVALTPAECKGMEYQTVCVLDPGRVLKRLDQSNDKETKFSELDLFARRTAVDQFRVAVSRATQRLIFADFNADDRELALSHKLLGEYKPRSPQEMVEYLIDAGRTPEERALVLAKEARDLFEQAPARSWQRIRQAVAVIDSPGFPSVELPDLCTDIRLDLLSIACQMLVRGVVQTNDQNEFLRNAEIAIDGLQDQRVRNAFTAFTQWSSDRDSAPFTLLDTTFSLDGDTEWIHGALSSVSQTLQRSIENYASDPAQAHRYADSVERWLSVTDYIGDQNEKARALRREAVSTLLSHNKVDDAERVLSKVTPSDFHLTGRLREAQARFEEATEAFTKAGLIEDANRNRRSLAVQQEKDEYYREAAKNFERLEATEDALRNWRQFGNWQESQGDHQAAAKTFEHAKLHGDALRNWRVIGNLEKAILLVDDDADRKDLQWILDLEDLIKQRPPRHGDRLTEFEHKRLSDSLRLLNTPADPTA